MFKHTNYEVLISPNGEQTIRSTSNTSRTIIEHTPSTGSVRISRRA